MSYQMGHYADYLNTMKDFDAITAERKRLLKQISKLRGGRDILVIAADLSKTIPQVQIDYTDILPVKDQLDNLGGKELDIILETPGGYAEVVEDIVEYVRSRYEKVGIIIPGWAKSAGTIFAMSGDEILMGRTSGLGPIDAQIVHNGKRFSADAFLEGLDKIKKEVEEKGKLNPAYIPLLREISPGEIQHCDNAQNFSKELVTDWLAKYKFKYWDKHSDGRPVTEQERSARATEIAAQLCSQTKWLTHARSITIQDLEGLRIRITDFSKDEALNDAIMRYYTLMRMTFESTGIYKLFETVNSQISRFIAPAGAPPPSPKAKSAKKATAEFVCPKCNSTFKIQANLEPNVPVEQDAVAYPLATNMFKCPVCGTDHNLLALRLQIEAQSGKKVVP